MGWQNEHWKRQAWPAFGGLSPPFLEDSKSLPLVVGVDAIQRCPLQSFQEPHPPSFPSEVLAASMTVIFNRCKNDSLSLPF